MKNSKVLSLLIITLFFLLSSCGNTSSSNSQLESESVSDPSSPINDTSNQSENTEATQFPEGHNFSEGVAWVNTGNEGIKNYSDGWICVDTSGRELFSLNGAAPVTDFVDGVAIIDDGRIIDKTGRTIHSLDDNIYTSILTNGDDFDGNIVVLMHQNNFDGETKKVGVLDSLGNWIIEPTEQLTGGSLGHGILLTKDPNQCYDMIENRFLSIADGNRVVLSRSFSSSEGLLFVNPNTTIIPDFFYHYAMATSSNAPNLSQDDILSARKHFKRGFYDKDYNLVIDLSNPEYLTIYDYAGFQNGYCLLSIEKENGTFCVVIDKNGNFMFDPFPAGRFAHFSNGITTLKNSDDTFSYLDPTGTLIKEGVHSTYSSQTGEEVQRYEVDSRYPENGIYYLTTNGNIAF